MKEFIHLSKTILYLARYEVAVRDKVYSMSPANLGPLLTAQVIKFTRILLGVNIATKSSTKSARMDLDHVICIAIIVSKAILCEYVLSSSRVISYPE
jgi:hypothetical protein